MKKITISETDYQNYLDCKTTLEELAKKYSVCSKTILNKLKKDGKSSRLAIKKKNQKDDFFEIIDSEEKAYILGFYVGDGCVLKCDNNSYTFNITLQKNDEEILKKIIDIISPYTKLTYENKHINHYGYLTKDMCRLRISSKQIVETLEKHNLGFNKTYKQKSVANYVPQNLIRHFIRGYFDADGCISHSKGKRTINGKLYEYGNYIWNIISKDKSILEEIKIVLNYFDLHPNIYADSKGCFLISLTKKKEFQKLYKLLYENSTLYLNRKKEKFKKILDTIL